MNAATALKEKLNSGLYLEARRRGLWFSEIARRAGLDEADVQAVADGTASPVKEMAVLRIIEEAPVKRDG